MKKKLRQQFLKKRDSLSWDVLEEKSRSITRRLEADIHYQRAATILFYVSFRSEVQTLSAIKKALIIGKQVLVPISDPKNRSLRISRIKSLQELQKGTYGIQEPAPEFYRPVPSQEVDLVLVPGAVFDYDGYRIGYGGGYYDNLLAGLQSALPLGLAFEMQLIERLPREDHDRPVEKLITEERTRMITSEGD